MSSTKIKIGGASGFWGDAARSTPQLLATEQLDYIVYDYLAEITMSIMARARAKDADKGYALDFVSVAMAPNLSEIARQGVKVISNAGGVNPAACAAALRQQIKAQDLDLKVACVLGDDLIQQGDELAASSATEMFSGQPFPNSTSVQSINAYLGAFPIAQALALGADIVITGRCVDSAVTLGACIHNFGWQADELDKLAMGSLVGHILECGTQATGGNFTDWQNVPGNIEDMGYPIAEVQADGVFVCSKPEGTSGLVSVATVAEQMLYEIGDPQAYLLPDVACDFSQVTLTQLDPGHVLVEGATGRSAPDTYKVCVTYADQFRGGTFLSFYGIDADKKAQALGEAIFRASRRTFAQLGMPDFSETSIELIGAESQYGDFASSNVTTNGSREVAMKIAAKHPLMQGIGVMLKEAVGVALSTPPGLSGFQGARAKPSPIVRLFSFLLPKTQIGISIQIDGQSVDCPELTSVDSDIKLLRPDFPVAEQNQPTVSVPLIELAWGRSGDKGDKANIGIIARKAEYLPYICAALTEQIVAARFSHFLGEDKDIDSPQAVQRFLLPGSNAINFLLHSVLGGGGMASLRNDAQGKGFAQLLLAVPIAIPKALLNAS